MAGIAGLKLIVPSSATASTGTVSISPTGTVTFSGIEKLQVDGVFSATYDNYLIVASSLISVSGGTSLFMALRSGGTTESGSNYVSQRLRADGTTASGVRFTATIGYGADMGTASLANGGHTYVYGPYLTQPTAFRTTGVHDASGVTLADYAVTHTLSASYTGVEFGDNSVGVTQSGKVRFYGLSQ